MVQTKPPPLETRISQLLADPENQDTALHQTLGELWEAHQELVRRLERIARISDAYQSLARQKEQSLAERVNKQLRQLEKVARISDRYQQMMRDLNLALQEASTHDALTGLPNRRLLVERLKEESERFRRYARPFSVAMIDIDHFKLINDHFGHEIGDNVLVEVARVLDAEIREHDLCGRWGGEEFLVLLPETDQGTASQVLERLRQAVERLTVRVNTASVSVTISVGLAEHLAGNSYSDTINRADGALLAAKRSGRNRASSAVTEDAL